MKDLAGSDSHAKAEDPKAGRHDLYQTLLEQGTVGALACDLKGLVTFANAGFCQMVGRHSHELEQKASLVDLVHPEDFDGLQADLQRLTDQGHSFAAQRRFMRSIDSWVWARIFLQGHYDDQGKLTALVAVVIDISSSSASEDILTANEEQLRQRNESLEQDAAQRTAALIRQTERLRRLANDLTLAERRERQRVARVLHDGLQQILVAAAFHLPDKGEGIDRVRSLLKEGVQACRDLSLELSPPRLQDSTLGRSLEWLAGWIKDNQQQSVEIVVQPGFPALPEELKIFLFSAVRELLLDSLEHSGVGASVHLGLGKGGALRVELSDAGPLVEAEALGEEDGLPRTGPMSLRERFEALGGELKLLSVPGKNASVLMTLPAQPAPAAVAVEPVPEMVVPPIRQRVARAGGTRLRIIVADDHRSFREGIVAVLERQNDVELVRQAEDGTEAVELVSLVGPDVVIMDINMPGTNGIDATRLIAANWPSCRVIGLSLLDKDEGGQAILDAGASAYLTKACTAEELLAAVRGAAGQTLA